MTRWTRTTPEWTLTTPKETDTAMQAAIAQARREGWDAAIDAALIELVGPPGNSPRTLADAAREIRELRWTPSPAPV